jgi:hypothetical protein
VNNNNAGETVTLDTGAQATVNGSGGTISIAGVGIGVTADNQTVASHTELSVSV